jgi:acetyltransferase-like isoleucine patch superfamily enzyme
VAEDYCEIQGLSKEGIVFGEHVVIGRFAMIRPSGYYGREIGTGLKVGDHSSIGPYGYIGCSGGIEVGDNVIMGPRVSMFAENHNDDLVRLPIREQGVTRETIIIEDDCWIGSGAIILAGVRVGKGSVIAAGSVVTHDIPPFSVAAGSPARVIRSRTDTT